MNIAIRYYSRSGNTKKLADAIGSVLQVKPEPVSVPLKEPVDILFLGSSVYAAGVDDSIKSFISSLDPSMVKEVVNFSTAALLPGTYNQVEKLLKERNIPLSKDEFHCKGSFMFMHKGHPDSNDLNNVKAFAKKVCHE